MTFRGDILTGTRLKNGNFACSPLTGMVCKSYRSFPKGSVAVGGCYGIEATICQQMWRNLFINERLTYLNIGFKIVHTDGQLNSKYCVISTGECFICDIKSNSWNKYLLFIYWYCIYINLFNNIFSRCKTCKLYNHFFLF